MKGRPIKHTIEYPDGTRLTQATYLYPNLEECVWGETKLNQFFTELDRLGLDEERLPKYKYVVMTTRKIHERKKRSDINVKRVPEEVKRDVGQRKNVPHSAKRQWRPNTREKDGVIWNTMIPMTCRDEVVL